MKSNKRPHIQGAKKLGRRKGWKSADKTVVEEQRNNRGDLVHAKNAEQHCFRNLWFSMHDEEQTWHLSHKSNPKHSYHMLEDKNAKTLNKNVLNDDKLAKLNILYISVGLLHQLLQKQ